VERLLLVAIAGPWLGAGCSVASGILPDAGLGRIAHVVCSRMGQEHESGCAAALDPVREIAEPPRRKAGLDGSGSEPPSHRLVDLGSVEQVEVSHPEADPLVGGGEGEGQLWPVVPTERAVDRDEAVPARLAGGVGRQRRGDRVARHVVGQAK